MNLQKREKKLRLIRKKDGKLMIFSRRDCIRKFSYHEIFCSFMSDEIPEQTFFAFHHVFHAFVHPSVVSKRYATCFCHVRTFPV